jgi:hypothetical protein
MLLKSADDRSKRVRLLESLITSPALDAKQKEWVHQELDRLRKGIQGEKSAAHYLDSYIGESKNHVLIHDLRIVVDGSVAQIDHMLMNRSGSIIMLETKNFNGNVSINELGEFTVSYGPRQFGIPSPIEQSKRHEKILTQLLSNLGIEPRVGGRFDFFHMVLMDPKATITRPQSKTFDANQVMKADMFPKWHKEWIEKDPSMVETFRFLANVRSQETIQEWGKKLIDQHQPSDLLELPPFIQPRTAPPAPTPKPVTREPTANQEQARSTTPATDSPPSSIAKKLICAHCNAKISFPEGKFCWGNERRFGGLQYCREHQALFN